MFVLNSDITIGNFRFSGVHEVRVKRSLHTYMDSAIIKLPSICKLIKNGKENPETLITGRQFNEGDPVTINLGYNGQLKQEFKGFVKRKDLDMPLEVECEGYSWQLKRNRINGFWQSISVKELLQLACSDTDIQVEVTYNPVLSNIQADNCTGAQLIDLIKKVTDWNLSIFFIKPSKLWCGLVYTPWSQNKAVFGIGKTSYRLGYNCIKDNDLQQRGLDDAPLQVNYIRKTANGEKLREFSDPLVPALRTYRKFLNHIAASPDLKTLAQEKQDRENYIGYEGWITGFLQPYAQPGYSAYIADARYPGSDGNYLVESTEIIYGIMGARRIVEIGPKQGFANS